MQAFIEKHKDLITSPLGCFDRVIFKGYLPLSRPEVMERFLDAKGVLIKDLKPFVLEQSERICEHAETLASRAGRPFIFQETKLRKEDYARDLAKTDGILDGLICVFRALEPCQSFKMAFGDKRPRLVSATRKCLFYYFYFLDREFGLMHIKLQSWFPFTVQIYVNGHEWLARKLDLHGVGYRRIDNVFTWLENPKRAQLFSDRFATKDWPAILAVFARRVNPLLSNLLAGQTYYWVTDQAEYALDIPFKNRSDFAPLYSHWLKHATLCFGAEDILRFLGKKLHGAFKGEVLTDSKRRPMGARVKHRVKTNWIKMYDKAGLVLRIETVINQPREFKVRRQGTRNGCKVLDWFPMAKGVANLRHYAIHARRACEHYLDALAAVDNPAPALERLDRLCETTPPKPKPRRGLNPLRRDDQALFAAVMRGEGTLHGFRHSDVARQLGLGKTKDHAESRRRSAKVSRLIHLLRAHGLVAKVPRTRRYRVTPLGNSIMGSAIRIRHELPKLLSPLAS
jgi:hypothetical protein